MLDPELLVQKFGEDFNLYHELMVSKVRDILLISSPYDAFVLEEDGSLAFRIINEYHGLNLSSPPRLTSVSTAKEALQLIRKKKFDLVLTMPFVGTMDAYSLGSSIKKIKPRLPVILLTASLHSLNDIDIDIDRSDIDKTYVWTGDTNLLLAIIKNVEDHANVKRDTKAAMVRVLILIEDSPECLSSFLPLLYSEVVRQIGSVLDESLNEDHQLLKMRARPKILVASNYEEAMKFFRRYNEYVFCVISDTRFSRNDVLDDNAGVRFLRYVRKKVPDMPLLLMSSDPSNQDKADTIPAVFINKNQDDILQRIDDFFLKHLGFGAFVFRMPDGTEVDRVENFHAFEKIIFDIPEESLVYHAQLNHFSNWIMARSEIGMALALSKLKPVDFQSVMEMRSFLAHCVRAFRKWRQLGIVANFPEHDFDPQTADFVKIGQGSMGGKARGIAFMSLLLRKRPDLRERFAGLPIKVPKSCVIANDGFNSFVEQNNLFYLCGGKDKIITNRFLASKLPVWLKKDLTTFLTEVTRPLAVRSSSMLEDAQFRPYAGLYKTYMLPNNHPDFKVRLEQLERAVKMVYASTYFESPRSFSKSIGQTRQDSMSVIIQQLVGQRDDKYFYPVCSGVAQSHNFYPISYMQPDDGIASMALGFGRTVVEGEKCLRFSPKFPKILPQFSSVDEMMNNTQRYLYALDMTNTTELANISNLQRLEISDQEDSPAVQILCSTYIEGEHRVRDYITQGPKLATFAQVLKHKAYPLPEILTEMLELGRQGMGCAVEIEFAIDLSQGLDKGEFYLLQIRPLAIGADRQDIKINCREKNAAFCLSYQALGHGVDQQMTDIIIVKPENFSAAKTRLIAKEIGVLNARLIKNRRKYLLIGPGRWGSADYLLGIPVQWNEIAGVGAIVELLNTQLSVEPSQGTHFFQNITSLGIPYLTVKEDGHTGDLLDWQWLNEQSIEAETEFLRHLRLASPITLKVNGKTSEAVILPTDLDFDCQKTECQVR